MLEGVCREPGGGSVGVGRALWVGDVGGACGRGQNKCTGAGCVLQDKETPDNGEGQERE